ncbi:MAG: FAD-dependent oxidoreductase [Phycisphaerales bacterium]|nr:FAD-dependent oxidoreductase [Phycisphaerales bacterium]
MSIKSDEKTYDALIVGAGPAGSTAAAWLAAQKFSVCLIDAAKFPRRRDCSGWISAKAGPLLDAMGLPIADVAKCAIKTVTFHNADMSKSARPALAGPVGYLVDRDAFDHQVAEMARKRGAVFLDDRRVARVQLGEQTVTLELSDGQTVRGKFLVLAAGKDSALVKRLGLPIDVLPPNAWTAYLTARDKSYRGDPSVSVVLGIDRRDGFATVVQAGDHLSVNVHSFSEKREVVTHLVTLCRNLSTAGLVGVDLTREASAATASAIPTAAALSMETHVAKRTLIIGDAGGFIAAASAEGIYPAMWSARIAAEIIEKAARHKSPQDVLMRFNTEWRSEMADYLRAPNTDTQYILPLVFTNQPMADRMAAAFFAGENI